MDHSSDMLAKHRDVSGAIIVFKKSGERGMKWQCDQRNWCIFGSHKDCDIQLRSAGVAEMQALVLLDSERFSLEQLAENKSTVVPGIGVLRKGQKIFLESGQQFHISNRHFGIEICQGASKDGRQSKATHSTGKKNGNSCVQSSSESGRKFLSKRRTSLVLAAERHMFVEASTNTELFPSSVFETPSEKVSAVLNSDASPDCLQERSCRQEIARRINLSGSPPGEDEEVSTDPEESESESADSNEGNVNEVEVESTKQKSESNLSSDCVSNDETRMSTARNKGGDIHQKDSNRVVCGITRDGPRSFSRWPRGNSRPNVPRAPDPNSSETRFKTENGGKKPVPGVTSASTKSAASLRRETAFDRLSRGLPSTPMRLENRLGSNLKNPEKVRSARRSVLFSKTELGRGPHYSPAPMKSKSRLPVHEEENRHPNTNAFPVASPKLKPSDDTKFLAQKEGLPSSTKLQQLGEFFYPSTFKRDSESNLSRESQQVNDDVAHSLFEPGRCLFPERRQSLDNSSTSRSDLELSEEESFFTTTSGTCSSAGDGNDLSSISIGSSEQSSFATEDSSEESVMEPSSKNSPDILSPTNQSSVGTEAEADDEKLNPEAVKTTSPWRRSLLGAVLDAAKSVTERFSIGGASTGESPPKFPAAPLDFDPEDLETASESEGSLDYSDEQSGSLSSTVRKSTGSSIEQGESTIYSTDDTDLALDDQEIGVSTKSPAAKEEESRYLRGEDVSVPNNDEELAPVEEEEERGQELGDKTVEVSEMKKFENMNFFVLKKHLKNLGLSTAGKKEALLERLDQFLRAKSNISESSPIDGRANLVEPEVSGEVGEKSEKHHEPDGPGDHARLEIWDRFGEKANEQHESESELKPNRDMLEPSEKVSVFETENTEGSVRKQASPPREEYEIRTVKELRQFMKRQEIEIPPRIKKAELIDLVIANNIDSSGNLIGDHDAETCQKSPEKSNSIDKNASCPSTPAKRTEESAVPEIDLITPIRKSTRRNAATKIELPTDDGKDIKADQSSRRKNPGVLANEKDSVEPATKKVSARKKTQKTITQATPVRRSARKRNPVPRFEE